MSASTQTLTHAAVKTGGMTVKRIVPLALISLLLWLAINSGVDTLWNLRLAYFAIYATALVGMVILVGMSGQVSLGQGAFMAVGGYTFAVAVINGIHPAIATVLAAIAGILLGLLIGAVAARLTGPYLAGVTLALAAGLPALANRFPDTLGGDPGLILDGGYPPEALGLEFPFERWQAWIAGIIAILTICIAWLIADSAIGRRIRAVRDHEAAAQLAGINAGRTKVLAFTVSAACAALAGAAFAQVLGLVAPGAFGIGLSLSLLVGVIIGGRHSMWGALLGAGVLVTLPELTTSVSERIGIATEQSPTVATLVYGALLLGAVAFFPNGLSAARIRR
jgi:branched-chain amino acid transport system permease protein